MSFNAECKPTISSRLVYIEIHALTSRAVKSMSSASSTDAVVEDSGTKGTLLSGHEKRTAFKNRWLSRPKSSLTVPGQSGQGDCGPETVSLTTAGSGPAAKNRWLKTLLTTNVLRRNSSKCTEELAQSVGPDVNPSEVCMMSDSPYYVLTVSNVCYDNSEHQKIVGVSQMVVFLNIK